MDELKWQFSEDWSTLELHFPEGFLWIKARPAYCDRGHWELNCDARALGLDGHDMFPRFFHDLSTAVKEAEAFLTWRIGKQRHKTWQADTAGLLRKHDGRPFRLVRPSGDGE